MSNQELLLNKIQQDWEAYREEILARSKESIFAGAFFHQKAYESKQYLKNFSINAIEHWGNAEEIYKTLLALPNIIYEFANYHSFYLYTGDESGYPSAYSCSFYDFMDYHCTLKEK